MYMLVYVIRTTEANLIYYMYKPRNVATGHKCPHFFHLSSQIKNFRKNGWMDKRKSINEMTLLLDLGHNMGMLNVVGK